MMHTFHSK